MSRRLLLADDSVTIQKVIELTFSDGDYELITTSDGTQALAKLAEERPDLVLADVHMPGASGLEVCRRVKERDPGLPVVLLVGTFEPFDEADAASAGADAFLKKPFDSQELIRLVGDLISKAAPPAPAPSSPPAIEPPAPSVPPAMEPLAPAVGFDAEDDLELDTWDKLEIAAGSFAAEEEAPEPVWGNLDSALTTAELPGLAEAEPEELLPAVEAPVVPVASPAPTPFEHGGSWNPTPEQETVLFEVPAARIAERLSAAPPPAPVVEPAPVAPPTSLSDADVDRIARRLVALLGDKVVREIAWEVIPDVAELVIKDRIKQLEAELEPAL